MTVTRRQILAGIGAAPMAIPLAAKAMADAPTFGRLKVGVAGFDPAPMVPMNAGHFVLSKPRADFPLPYPSYLQDRFGSQLRALQSSRTQPRGDPSVLRQMAEHELFNLSRDGCQP